MPAERRRRSRRKRVRFRTSSRNPSSSEHPCQHLLTSFNEFIVGANIEPGERHNIVQPLDLFQLHDFSEQINNFTKRMEKNASKEKLKKEETQRLEMTTTRNKGKNERRQRSSHKR
ncbi:hypothetical protein Q1695_003449 [Nippostrongylus brasiliensis]|nr:hypothetical protein Q1695_003449 [Nippostrongylus brasiliensis]